MIDVLDFSCEGREEVIADLSVKVDGTVYTLRAETYGAYQAVDQLVDELAERLGLGAVYSMGIWINWTKGTDAVSTSRLAHNPNSVSAGTGQEVYEAVGRALDDTTRAYLNAHLAALGKIIKKEPASSIDDSVLRYEKTHPI